MTTTSADTQDHVQFRVREFGAVPIPELLPAGGRVLTIQIVGHPHVRQFGIPMEWVISYQEVVRAAARAKQTYWVDLSDAGAFDHPNRSYTDSIPLRILKAIHNRQIVTEAEGG